jgi:hypothetical protein
MAAVALREDNAIERPAALLSRAEVLTRYRHLREISRQHHSAVLDFLSKDTIISQARRLGLAQGKTLVLDSTDDLNFAFFGLLRQERRHDAEIGREFREERLSLCLEPFGRPRGLATWPGLNCVASRLIWPVFDRLLLAGDDEP